MENRIERVLFEDTKFIYKTNFSGDPDRDGYGSTTRKGCVIIPDEELAQALLADGFNVKISRPTIEGAEPQHYINIIVNYESKWPPKIYLVSGEKGRVLLDRDSVGMIDDIYVRNVNVSLSPHINKRTGRKTLYVDTMYVEQEIDRDPFAARYARHNDDINF